MATGIDYVDETINYVSGCSKVSSACKNCYAETMTKRLQAMGQKKYEFGFDNIVEHWGLLDHKFKKTPKRYFVNSMSDTFHPSVTWNFQYEMFKRFAQNPQHTFLIFTKRAKLLKKRLEDIWFHLSQNGYRTPLKNVWVIVTVENQEMATLRIPYLLKTPAHIRGISIEPMLSPVNLWPYVDLLDWVILGGESGPNARPMHPDWIRLIRDQCKAENIPFWFKQWGEWREVVLRPKKYKTKIIGSGVFNKLVMEKAGKKRAGDLIDGKQYKHLPDKNYTNFWELESRDSDVIGSMNIKD